MKNYVLQEAQGVVDHAIKSVQAGSTTVEDAVASAVSQTILAFAEIMTESESCCGCHWMEGSNALYDLAAELKKQYQQVTV